MEINIYIGESKLIDNHHIHIGEKTLSSKSFIISTGSNPFISPVEGLNDIPYLTNVTIPDLKELPQSMIIIGGGPIGSEMASSPNRLGQGRNG